ncbi:hypothetical protein N7495_000480 [Penicillium taxi]|uniref:uncharacterized protein n=1 Tax=Penicillium taxi TaxID=168475 RepID=UPI002544FB22|nr:uncharacterized protein N7495_000480 [Penicillium taxi]KAJ5907798.1 hypothetical protein N7495_000480 [Penicillium taxi]
MESSSSLSQAKSLIAAGTVSMIYAIDNNKVIKSHNKSGIFERQAYEIEIRCYERLGHHERIASCEVTDEGLILERGTCLRKMLQNFDKSAITWIMKRQWALEAAEGLSYIHSKGIIHADVGCHNIIVDHSKHIKFIDFAGSGIDGDEPLVCYEWCSFNPVVEIGVCSDIFAFGSMLFELESGCVPYHELESTLEMGKLVTAVEKYFSQQKFPSVETLAFRSVITGCWNGKYTSIDRVYQDIALVQDQLVQS